ncbi:MAG: hypothetical protein KDC88_14945 [Ignavibacteriae bacterium]|nr:hypothetical protein [Ignavibacteriota bacterium]
MELRRIQVYEFGWLRVGSFYDDIEFKQIHFDLLVQYLTVNPSCPYYSLFHQRIKFKNYVGVIKVRDLLIEVLPKTDHHEETKDVWQRILLQMLNIALSVEAKTTTKANINLKHGNVLETYILHFLRETESIIYEGLVKKYRVNESNKYALTGKLIIHKQITKNLVHAERFWVLHQIYDHDNIYNRILYETLKVITTLKISQDLTNHAKFLTDFFPEC